MNAAGGKALQLAGLSETQARHFLHLYEKVHHLGGDGRAVIQREMDSRRRAQIEKAAGFAAVTETEGCFRESLLAYFNEQKSRRKRMKQRAAHPAV